MTTRREKIRKMRRIEIPIIVLSIFLLFSILTVPVFANDLTVQPKKIQIETVQDFPIIGKLFQFNMLSSNNSAMSNSEINFSELNISQMMPEGMNVTRSGAVALAVDWGI
jgi:hypothetical protein